MNELSVRRFETKKATERAALESAREVVLALIRQPATGLLIASIGINGALRAGWLTPVQAGMVQSVVLTGAALTALGLTGQALVGALK